MGVKEGLESMVTLTDVWNARERIRDRALRTPLIFSPSLSQQIGNEVYLKLENLQLTGAFKVRGNLNKLYSLSGVQGRTGLVTATTGNHGQGLAYAAKCVGMPVTVVVPEGAARTKIASVEALGARIVISGRNYDDAARVAHAIEEEEGLTYVHSFDDPHIIAGQGTIGLEILEDLPDVDLVVAPIGGGGLISGLGVALKESGYGIKLVGVEAHGAPSMYESIKRGAPTELSSASTMADGIAVRRPGDLTFEMARRYVDGIVLVSDDEILSALRTLALAAKLVVEGAGAASVAALLSRRLQVKHQKVVCVISGGNIDAEFMKKLL